MISREGVLTVARRAGELSVVSPARRMLFLFAGSVFIGIGVGAFLRADLGLPPYDVALSAVSSHTPLSHGQAGWLLGAALFGVASLFRRFPNLPAMGLVVMNGLAIDAAHRLIRTPEGLPMRWLYVGLGLGFVAGGLAILLRAGSSGGALELLMEAGAERGASPTTVRTGLEVVILVGGAAAGGSIGAATFVFALAIGPAMRLSMQAVEDHRRGRLARLHSLPV